MALHLVVAYETAASPELRAELTRRAKIEAQASFVLLVPATPRRYLLFPREGEARTTAQHMADSAQKQLQQDGLNVVRAFVGHRDPLRAIREELSSDQYASIIVCTHPADVSHWLKAGVPTKAQAFGLPVSHIVVKSVAELARRGSGRPPFPDTLMPG